MNPNLLSNFNINNIQSNLENIIKEILNINFQNQKEKLILKNKDKETFCEINLNINSGYIRNLKIIVPIFDFENKKKFLCFYLEDETIPYGKYKTENDTFNSYSIYPLAFQIEYFKHFQYISLYLSVSKKEVLPKKEKVLNQEDLSLFYELFQPLFQVF